MPAGFYWTANNPYLKPIWVKGSRAPKGLNPDFAMLNGDANPAHIVYECLTHRDLMGCSPALIDVDSYNAAAETLFNEGFHLTMLWTQQAPIENFISEVLDHIHATHFINPRTGLMTLKLLRADFDIDSLRTITPDNAILTNYQRKTWGETANEVVVSWTNPLNEQEETVVAQDLANIAMQGGVITSSKNYYAIRNRALADAVAQRDLRAMSEPLASVEAELLRSEWAILPGEVVKVTWPEKGISQVVCRAGSIDYGKPGGSSIKVGLMEDIFSLDSADYLDSVPSAWTDPGSNPAPLTNVLIQTAPAFLTASLLGEAATVAYPEVMTLVIAAKNDTDDQDFELIARITEPNGELIYSSLGTRHFVGSATLAASIPAEAETVLTTFSGATGDSPRAGQFVMIGDGDDEAVEIALVTLVTDTTWTFSRGVLDTVPRSWPSGTRLWSLPLPQDIADVTLRSDGEDVAYRLLTRTTRGLLAFDDASPDTLTLSGRPHLPNRPANVAIAGTHFGPMNLSGLTALPVTWANRNRLMETSQIVGWGDGGVAPESGQTTKIVVMKTDRTVLTTHAGLVGSSYTLDLGDFIGESSGIVRVTAERDGLESLQAHEIAVTSVMGHVSLSGSITQANALHGDLSVQTVLSGRIKGESDLSGSMQPCAVLTGAITGASSLQGSLGSTTNLSGTITSSGTLQGDISP